MDRINFTEWKYFKRKDKFDFIKPEYKISEGTLMVKLAGEKYTSAQFDSEAANVKPGYEYSVYYRLKTDNSFARMIYGWYGKDGVIVKGYLNASGETLLAPEGAETLKITLRFNGFTECEGVISGLYAVCEGEYKPKKVSLATVAIPNIYYPKSQPPEYNLSETVKVIDRLCSREKPDIIALTETFYTRKTLLPLSEMCNPIDCEAIEVIKKKAKQYNTYIAFSFHEEENGLFYNSGILIDRNGEIKGKCHKCHLTMGEYESGLTPGQEINVFQTDFGKVGFAICWDIFFPEHIRVLQKCKVDVIINPTAGYRAERISERCRESGAFIVTSTAASFEKSAIFNPKGEMLCNAGLNFGYACVEVDIKKPNYYYYQSYPAYTDAKNIYLNEARFDLY